MSLHPAASPASDAGIFLWMTWQAMQRAGLDTAAIFAGIGMPDEAPDPGRRRDNSTQQRFWLTAERISGDPDVGLHTGEHMPVFRGQVLEYLFLSSPTFGEGLQRALRFNRLITDALQLGLRIEGDDAVLSGLAHPVRHYLEIAVSVFLGFLRHVSGGEFRPREIWLPYGHGAAPAEYARVYGCPVRTDMPEGAIRFDAALLQRASPAAEPDLLAMHETLAAQRMAELDKADVIVRIERELGDLLERGDVSLETVAQRLGRHPRSLRADLAGLDTSFNAVVARYRERLARRLLARTATSLDQIVYLTGFSEPSAFTRAFKRWTGETPTGYRERKHGEAART